MKPIFNNIENKKYNTKDGIVWDSRSCAVVAHIYTYYNEELYVLAIKRGEHGDAKGLWCLPCGYLDWNENLKEARNREVFEETNLDLTKYKNIDNIFSEDQPFHVYTNPDENRQNIAMHVGFVHELAYLPDVSNVNASYKEVDEVKWLSANDIIKLSDSKQWAFNHDEKLKLSLLHIINN